MNFEILIVDDERLVRNSLQRLLRRDNWNVHTAEDVQAARDFLKSHAVDLLIIDYKLGKETGLDLLEHVRQRHADAVAIMLTAYGNISLAVEAIKKGAYDFLQKEGDPQITLHVVEKALEKVRLRKEVQLLKQERARQSLNCDIVAASPAMKRVIQMADEFANTDSTILIQGETGSGKSVIAEYIHCMSPRRDGPFVTINCGAIPKELIESELFGYEKGAFTGANHDGKIGLIKRADAGTLFLDEIGDLALELQSKLLYVLEKGEYLGVGAVEPTKVDVRFVAATNADLEKLLAVGQFRQDLYYRLNVASMQLPPLRERKDDIVPLTRQFVVDLNRKLGKSVTTITAAAERRLTELAWPGNIRELHNVIERVMLLKKNDIIDDHDLQQLNCLDASNNGQDSCRIDIDFKSSTNALQDATRQVVCKAWEACQKNQTHTARLLGIPRTTLQTYLQKFDLI